MSSKLKSESRAVKVALEHIEAWSNRNYERARKSLSDNVHVTVMTTQPTMSPTDTAGIDEYMDGLIKFTQIVVPGSAEIIASDGDEQNALIMVRVKATLGPNGSKVPLVGSRLYSLNEEGKIRAEQVVFCVLGN